MDNLATPINLVKVLPALKMSKRQTLQTIGLLSFSIAENSSVDYELVDWGLWELPEKVIELCMRLSEIQMLEAINRLSYQLIQDACLQENNVPR